LNTFRVVREEGVWVWGCSFADFVFAAWVGFEVPDPQGL
jgi:hypothetical protein